MLFTLNAYINFYIISIQYSLRNNVSLSGKLFSEKLGIDVKITLNYLYYPFSLKTFELSRKGETIWIALSYLLILRFYFSLKLLSSDLRAIAGSFVYIVHCAQR